MRRDDLVASAAYHPEPTAAAAARRFVRDTLEGWIVTGAAADGHGLVDDAVLLTSELVTNAVVHAGTPVQVTCRVADGTVEVVVSDHHPARLVPEPAENEHSPAERTSGRGLLLPAALAAAWGVTYGRASKSVWFRLGLTGVGPGVPGGLPGAHGAAEENADGASGDGAVLAMALRSASVIPAPAGRAAPSPGGGPPPAGDDAYRRLLASTLESARSAASADAAFALMPDEDGDLRLQAAVGDLALPEAPTAAAGAGVPGGAWLAAVRASTQAAPSLATVPFVVDGQVTGLLTVAATTSGRFGDMQTARLQRLADRWGPALQRAWLAGLEQVRRGRMSALADTRGLLAGGLDEPEVLELASRATVPRLAAWCAVLLGSADEGLRVAHVCHAGPGRSQALGWLLERACRAAALEPLPWSPASPGDGRPWPLAGAACGVMPNGDGGEPTGGAGAPAGAQELAADTAWCFPLGAAKEPAGLFVIGGGPGGRLPREVAALAADLACRAGIALDHARLAGQQR